MSRTKPLRLVVDDRTGNLTDQALICRTFGHKWGLSGIPRSRFLSLLAKGQGEYNRYCENGCGSTWRQLWDVRTGEVLENERNYPKNGEYLLPSGTGRMHRTSARVANFARQNPAYA